LDILVEYIFYFQNLLIDGIYLNLTVKQWTETRWESRINSVKSIRFQVKNVMHALNVILETSEHPITKSEVLSLLNEVGSFEFLLS